MCFYDLLVAFAANYDLNKNEFTKNFARKELKILINQAFHDRNLSNLSIRDLFSVVEQLNINKLFRLRIQISSRLKLVNTQLKENTKIFLKNGRFCYRIDLQLSNFIYKSTNPIKALIETGNQ
jgi:predicted XRE-type DNA-binding protein